MPSDVIVDGLGLDMLKADLAAGKQGKVHLVVLSSAPDKRMILKEMLDQPNAWPRAKFLTSACVPALSVGLSGPIVSELGSDGMIRHVSPYVDGDHLENAPPASLPQNLEMALELVTNAAILEEHGLCHGDVAESNVMYGADRSVAFIDCDGFASTDPDVPAPLTLGQHHMIAPELRSGTQPYPNQMTDRFALAVFLNTQVFCHHALDGLADTPTEVDVHMSQGIWPERNRFRELNETPIEALGDRLLDLFDRAFLLDPTARPTPEDWRQGFIHALDNCWIHDCGNAFVSDAKTTHCPFCQQAVSVPNIDPKLYVIVGNGIARCSSELKDRQTITLGRETLPNMAATVSARHLDITPIGSQLFLRHRGSNPTLIDYQGTWYQLAEHWVDITTLGQTRLMLAETEIMLEIK